MVATNAQDAIKVLAAKPIIQFFDDILVLLEDVFEITAMDQYITAKASKRFVLAMRVADNGEFHTLQSVSTVEASHKKKPGAMAGLSIL